MAQLHKALVWVQRKGWGQTMWGRNGNSLSLYWFIVSVNRPQKQTGRNTPGRLDLQRIIFFSFVSAQFTNSTKPVEETQETERLTLLLLILVEAGVNGCQSMLAACI